MKAKDGSILDRLRYWEANQQAPFITDARVEIERLMAQNACYRKWFDDNSLVHVRLKLEAKA